MSNRAVWPLLVAVVLGGHATARGDGSTGARSTDAVAKERADEFEDLGKKDTLEAINRRLEILESLEFAPCQTARRFLLRILGKSGAAGDERLYALLSLVKIAEPETLEDVLRVLTREKDPTLWEAFGEALGDRLSEPVRAWLEGPALDATHPETLCACLEGLSKRPSPARAPRIAALVEKHRQPPGRFDVAYRALRALARTAGADARPALAAAARNPQWQIRLAPAEALPTLEPFDSETEAAVRALLQDENPSVRQAAAAGAGAGKRLSLAASLVGMLADPRIRTRHVAARSLEQISGRQHGLDAKAWAAWLEKRDPEAPRHVTVPTYHGISVHSDRVVFVVDASSSMAWPWRKPTHRIDVARSELAAVLRALPSGTLFNVLVFSNKVASWKKGETAASPANVDAAVAWAEKAMAEPKGDTHLYEALDAAFSNNPQFDTVFLLTDGNPTHGRYWTRRGLLASVRAWTVFRRTAIHTIGLSLREEDLGMPNLTENLQVMSELLAALAAATSGEFREIRKVPAAK